MLRFRHVLCPIDFDDNSLAALSVAAKIARENGAALHLLHVVTVTIVPEAVVSSGEAENAAQSKLERIAHQKLKAGATYELSVATGQPAVEILDAASQLDIDLIVMATHGRKGLNRLVIGSVTERVVREARCPVLTIKTAAVRARIARTPSP